MTIVGKKVLEEFGLKHADVQQQIGAWVCEVEDANWESPGDIRKRYPSASLLSQHTVVFNLKGNKYRLEAKISFTSQVVLVTRIGTHAEYSKWSF